MSDDLAILTGDALAMLKTLPEASVQCCITSPPYWNLRDYKIAGQLGLEKTPEEYVSKLVEIFGEVRRVLRDDGTLWMNMGDCYNGSGNPAGCRTKRCDGGQKRVFETADNLAFRGSGVDIEGLKPKDLVGMPWRLAFALRESGWWLRSDIVWEKLNPMPESVTDRPTRSHEFIFLLAKSERYFYDHYAIMEPASMASLSRINQENFDNQPGGPKDPKSGNRSMRKTLENWADKQRGHSRRHAGFNERWDESEAAGMTTGMRNKRDVWVVPTASYKEAHFATYPPELIRPCVLAGTSSGGCCPKCGAPYRRVVNERRPPTRSIKLNGPHAEHGLLGDTRFDIGIGYDTTGWKPSCDCNAGKPVGCTVLDPFGGSGTTAMVALEEGRRAITIELNPEYVKLIERRCRKIQPRIQI